MANIFKHILSGPNAAGDIWSSGFHSSSTAVTGTPEAHTNFAGEITTALTGGILAQWAANTHVTELTTYMLNATNGHAIEVTRSSVSLVGTSVGLQPSPRDCMVVGLRTTTPGVSGRGRMFLPAPALSNFTSTGLLSLATRTAVADAMSNMFSGLLALGMHPGIWANGFGSTIEFNGVTVSQVPGTQRRRTNKIPNSYYAAAIA